MANLLKLNWLRSLNLGDASNPYLIYKMWELACKKIRRNSSYGIEENIGPVDLRNFENPNALSRIMDESYFLLSDTNQERTKMKNIVKNLYDYIFENKKMYFHI